MSYQKRHMNLNSLKTSLVKAAAEIPLETVCLSVCLSVHKYQYGSHRTDLREIRFGVFMKICLGKIQNNKTKLPFNFPSSINISNSLYIFSISKLSFVHLYILMLCVSPLYPQIIT